MDELLIKLSRCVELGKIDKVSPYPPDMKGQDGADELARQALDKEIQSNLMLLAAKYFLLGFHIFQL